MRRATRVALIFVILLSSQWLAGQTPSRRMTNQDVKDLVAMGFSTDVIIDKIRSTSATRFDTSVEGLKSLKAAQVPDAVIRVMINPVAVPAATTAVPAAPPPAAKGMSNQDVKDLVGMGFSSDIIIEKIRTAREKDFDTSVEGLKTLKAAHVPEAVITVMINPHASVTAGPAAASAPDPPRRAQEAAVPIVAGAPLKNVKAIQVDSTIVSDPDKVKEPSAPTLVQDSLKNALRAASIDIADSAPIHAHIVLEEFTSGSTAKRMLVGFGSGRSSVSCRLVLQDASGKEVSSTKIHVRGKLAFSPYESNSTQEKQAVTGYEKKLLEEIQRMKVGG